MSRAKQQQQIKETGIIMQPESVLAILEGRKTQTRRVITPAPIFDDRLQVWQFAPSKKAWSLGDYFDNKNDFPESWLNHCPYGQAGDRLWVRETWAHYQFRTADKPRVVYRADDELHGALWRPSIFLRRKDSRITLEITGVRVERLQDISRADTEAEGLGCDWQPDSNQFATFQRGWDSINTKRGYSWESNPWCWVIEFKKVTP